MFVRVPNLEQRCVIPELMDDPMLASDAHERALRGLRRINRLSNSAAILWPSIAHLAATSGERRLSLLDIATGSGDVPLALHRRAKRAGFELELHAVDISPQALAVAVEAGQRAGVEITPHQLDITAASPQGSFDIVTTNLFLHHLEERDAVTALQHLVAATKRLLLINDLRRSDAGYVAAFVGTRLLTRSPIVHTDGPRSVQAAFTPQEMEALCLRAGLASARVKPCFPWRMLVEYRVTT